MQINKLPYPSKYNPDITPKCNYAGLADFLGVQYAPTNDIDRHSMLLSATQHACHFSDSTDMKVQEYIDTILSQFPDFSLQTLDGLDSNQERLLTDMLMRMNLSKLHETFGDYILWFLISQSYPYGRYESHLKPYCEKHMNFVKKYGWGRADMLCNASWRLGFKEATFSEKNGITKNIYCMYGGIA